MSRQPLLDAGVVVGNRFDKYGSRNPLVRWFMSQFETGLDQLLAQATGVSSVLEVGCGEGHITARLARTFPQASVLGTDFSNTILGIARREYPEHHFEQRSIYDVGGDGPYDLVVACEVFEHLEDPERALEAVVAASRQWVVVTVPREPLWRVLNVVRGRYLRDLGNTEGHVQHWSRRQILAFLSTRLDIVDTRAPLPWTQVLARVRKPAS